MPADTIYEYRVVPAPKRGVKTRTARTQEDRFAAALTASLNEQGQDGWEFLRSDTLPSDERQGLTGRTTVYHTVLIYRRPVATLSATEEMPDLSPRRLITAPVFVAPAARPAPAAPPQPAHSPAPAHMAVPGAGPQAGYAAPDIEHTIIAQRLPDPGGHVHDAPHQVPPLGAAGPRLAGQ